MEDQRMTDMTELLRELPRERARSGFTARVLARLDGIDEPPQAPVRRWHPRLVPVALAASLALVVTAGVVIQEQRQEAQAEALRAVQALRAEHSRIERELQELSSAPPVYYLGGNEEMDLIVNMGEVRPDRGLQPATYRYDTF